MKTPPRLGRRSVCRGRRAGAPRQGPWKQRRDRPRLKSGLQPDRRKGSTMDVYIVPAAPGKPEDGQFPRFLKLLDPSADGFTFQTFDDDRSRKNPALTRIVTRASRRR